MYYRYISRRNKKKGIIGKYIIGGGQKALEEQHKNVEENRTLFLDFCRAQGLQVTNTQFQKQNKNLITFRDVAHADAFEAPWTYPRFATLDYCLIRDKWRNAITNVESRPDIYTQNPTTVFLLPPCTQNYPSRRSKN